METNGENIGNKYVYLYMTEIKTVQLITYSARAVSQNQHCLAYFGTDGELR